MDIAAVSASATVALAGATVFVLIARSWQALIRAINATPSFSGSIMHEAAQRFRDELERLSHTHSTYLSAVLIFALIFIVAHHFDAESLLDGYPEWQLKLLLILLLLAAVVGAYRLLQSIARWQRLRFVRDASIAIGHELQRLDAQHGRIFHDVETSTGIIDHVLAGQGGIYAVNVVARRHRGQGKVRLEGHALHFTPGEKTASTVGIASRTTRLERELRQLAGVNVRVRSVIALPGWEIESQSSDLHLLVNERNLPMLSGWRDEADYLLNEDVEAVQTLLADRCSRARAGREPGREGLSRTGAA